MSSDVDGAEGAEEEATLFEGLALLKRGRAAATAAAATSSETIRRAAAKKASAHHKEGFALINSVVTPGSPSTRKLRRRLSVYGSRPTDKEDRFLQAQQAAQRQIASRDRARKDSAIQRKSSGGLFGLFGGGGSSKALDADAAAEAATAKAAADADVADALRERRGVGSGQPEPRDGSELIMRVISHVSSAVSVVTTLDDPDTQKALAANEQPPLHADGRAALQNLGSLYDMLTRKDAPPPGTPRNLTVRETVLPPSATRGGGRRVSRGQVEVTCIFTESGRLGLKLAKGDSGASSAPSTGVSSSTSSYFAVVENISPHSMASDAQVPQGAYVSAINSISMRGKSYTRVMNFIKEAAVKRPLTIVFRSADTSSPPSATASSPPDMHSGPPNVSPRPSDTTTATLAPPLPAPSSTSPQSADSADKCAHPDVHMAPPSSPPPPSGVAALRGIIENENGQDATTRLATNTDSNNDKNLRLLHAQVTAKTRELEESRLWRKRLELEVAGKTSEIAMHQQTVERHAAERSSREAAIRKEVTSAVTTELEAKWAQRDKENAAAAENRLLVALRKRQEMERSYKDRIAGLERSNEQAEARIQQDAEEREAEEARREAALQAASQKIVANAVERAVSAEQLKHVEDKVQAVAEAVKRVSEAKEVEKRAAVEAALNEAKVRGEKELNEALTAVVAEQKADANARVQKATEEAAVREQQWTNDMNSTIESAVENEARLRDEMKSITTSLREEIETTAMARELEVNTRWKEKFKIEVSDAVRKAVVKANARAEERAAMIAKEEAATFEESLEMVKAKVAAEVSNSVTKKVTDELTKKLTEAADIEKAAAVANAVAAAEASHSNYLISYSAAADEAKAAAAAEAVASAVSQHESAMSGALEHARQRHESIVLEERAEAETTLQKYIADSEREAEVLRSDLSTEKQNGRQSKAQILKLEQTLEEQRTLVATTSAALATAAATTEGESTAIAALKKELAAARGEIDAERQRGEQETERAAAEVAAAETRAASEIATALLKARREADEYLEKKEAELNDTIVSLKNELTAAKEEADVERERGQRETEQAAAEVAAAEMRAAGEIAAALATARREAEEDMKNAESERRVRFGAAVADAVNEGLAVERAKLNEASKVREETIVLEEREKSELAMKKMQASFDVRLANQAKEVEATVTDTITEQVSATAAEKRAADIAEAVATVESLHADSMSANIARTEESHALAIEKAVSDAVAEVKAEVRSVHTKELEHVSAVASEEKSAALATLRTRISAEHRAAEAASLASHKREEEEHYSALMEKSTAMAAKEKASEIANLESLFKDTLSEQKQVKQEAIAAALTEAKAAAEAAHFAALEECRQKAASERAVAVEAANEKARLKIEAFKRQMVEDQTVQASQLLTSQEDCALEMERLAAQVRRDADLASERLQAEIEKERGDHSKSKSVISALEKSARLDKDARDSKELALRAEMAKERKEHLKSKSEVAALKKVVQDKRGNFQEKEAELRAEIQKERQEHAVTRGHLSELKSEQDVAKAEWTSEEAAAKCIVEKARRDKKRTIDAATEATAALTAELKKQIREKDLARAKLVELRAATEEAAAASVKAAKDLHSEISREKKAHNVTKSVLKAMKQKSVDAESQTSTALKAAEAASAEIVTLRTKVHSEKQKHALSKNLITELQRAVKQSQVRDASSEEKFQADLKTMRASLLAEHTTALKEAVKEERAIQRRAATRKTSLARATWAGKMEDAASEHAAASEFALAEVEANVQARIEMGVAEALAKAVAEEKTNMRASMSEEMRQYDAEWQQRLTRAREDWLADEQRRVGEEDARWSDEVRRAGERVQAAAADVLREKEETWNASIVNAVSQTEKKYTELLSEQRDRLERQSMRESQLAIRDVEARTKMEIERVKRERDNICAEKLALAAAETASEFKAERDAREDAEAQLRDLQGSFQRDWEAKLESAVDASVMEGAKVARKAARNEAAIEVEDALRNQKDKINKEWEDRLNHAVEQAVEATAEAAAEEVQIALASVEMMAAQRQAEAIMEAVAEATSIAMDEAAENKAKAIAQIEISSQEALRAQKSDLETLHELRMERQGAEIAEAASEWERKANELEEIRERQLKAQQKRLERVMEEALQMQRATLQASSAEALRASQRTKMAAINELKAEYAGKWRALEAAHDQTLREVQIGAERLVKKKILQLREAAKSSQMRNKKISEGNEDDNRARQVRPLLWEVDESFVVRQQKRARASAKVPNSTEKTARPRNKMSRHHSSTEATMRDSREEADLVHIEAAEAALRASYDQDARRSAEVEALRQTSRALKIQLRKAIQKEEEVRAAAARRSREKRLYERQKMEGVGHSGKKKKLMRRSLDKSISSPSSMFSPQTKSEIAKQALEVEELKYELASATAKIEHLTDMVEGRRGGRARSRIMQDAAAEWISEGSSSPAEEATAATTGIRLDDRLGVQKGHAPAPSPLTTTNRLYRRTNREFESLWQKEDSPGLEMLKKEYRPLKAMFDFYATKRKMTAGRSRQSRRKKPTMFMTAPDFSRFCFDFNLVPDLLSKPEAKYIFGEVVSEHNSGSGDEDEDMGMSSPDKQKPGLSFEGYLWCLVYVAIESALWPSEHKNGSGPGPSEEHQVFALLQWMDRSSGKKKLARNGRCSAVIGPFRSTVKTPRKKNSQERYKSC